MKKLLLGFLVATIMAGCYPEGPKYVADLDLVLTNYSDTFDFGDKQNYYLFDFVVHPEEDIEDHPIDGPYDQEILDKIDEKMQERGYTKVNTLDQSDIALSTTAWTSTTVNYYYPWYGGGYYWGYPSYGWGYAYSTTFGTVLIEMAYPDGIDHEQQIVPLVWRAAVNGMVEGSSSSVRTRIDDTIDQAFEQSPYIQSNL